MTRGRAREGRRRLLSLHVDIYGSPDTWALNALTLAASVALLVFAVAAVIFACAWVGG